MRKVAALCLLGCASLLAQQIPAPTDLPGDPFFIKKTWPVNSTADSVSSMLVDPLQHQLFLAYRQSVVVDDLQSGGAVGSVGGSSGALGIALDDTGDFGFISDGRYNQVDAFDRRTFQTVGILPTAANPTYVVFEPMSALIFVVCNEPSAEKTRVQRPPIPMYPPPTPIYPWNRSDIPPTPPSHSPPFPSPGRTKKSATPPESKWLLTVIDADNWKTLADILLPGKVGFAQTAGNGHVYLGFPGRNELARLDASALGERLRRDTKNAHATPARTPKEDQLIFGHLMIPGPQWQRNPARILDWSNDQFVAANEARQIDFFRLNKECGEPRALAVDEPHLRLFLACANKKLAVLNADNGDLITTLPTGPDTNAVAYDFDRRLVYAANAGGYGSLTIIRQDVTDSYAVVQSLPTPIWARALAVNPATGQIYLITDYTDSDSQQRISKAEKGDFQLLLIGH
jgi:DNA-binding beta-propeller fold protein YncE